MCFGALMAIRLSITPDAKDEVACNLCANTDGMELHKRIVSQHFPLSYDLNETLMVLSYE
jgi:hypothetical protein